MSFYCLNDMGDQVFAVNLALDTGKPKDNKITAMLYEWRNLTYQGEA